MTNVTITESTNITLTVEFIKLNWYLRKFADSLFMETIYNFR